MRSNCISFSKSAIARAALCFVIIVIGARGAWSGDREAVRLTHDGRLKFSPVAIGLKGEIIYCELADPTLYRITRLTLADGSTRPLHPEAQTSEFEPALSADGNGVAFLKTVGPLRVNLVIEDDAGSKLGEVVPGEGFSGMRSPAFAPDHSAVVYSFGERGRQQLFVVRSDGSGKKPLTDSSGINNWPSYSPDGKQIVFSSSRDGDFEVYVMNADGSTVRRLTESPGQDIRPRFSPDGKRIAFTSHRDGNAEIYVLDADGSRVLRMTESPDRDDYPDWMPDGHELVFVAERGGRHDLYRLAIDK
jgi:Tol biopolymer transport system component